VRISLLNVISSAGIPSALPVVRQALEESDEDLRRAALNALSNWPTPEPLDDLLALTKSGGETRRVLALRGYIKLIQVPSNRTPAETARLLKTALSAATQPAEKRTVLSIAQRMVCPESLDLARAALKDPEVQAEAQLATETLERALSFMKK
jgi:HEAT repeat protein